MKHNNCIHVWLKDGSTMQLYDVLEIRAYDGREMTHDHVADVDVISHHAFLIRTTEEDGHFFVRSLSPKTPVVKPSNEPLFPGLRGLGKLPRDKND